MQNLNNANTYTPIGIQLYNEIAYWYFTQTEATQYQSSSIFRSNATLGFGS